jgi:uncharacterized protein
MEKPLKLTVTEESLSICRLAKEDALPRWAWTGPFVSVTRTEQELSVVCAASAVPEGVQTEPGWRAIRVEGPLDFALTGILAGLTDPLAKASIGIFALSTFDTDYLLVPERHLRRAVEVLRASGYEVRANGHG